MSFLREAQVFLVILANAKVMVNLTYTEFINRKTFVVHKIMHFFSHRILSCPCRNSHPEVFCKKGVLRNFTKFTGKHLCQNLFFNKVAWLSPATSFKKRLWHRCFPVEFCEISKNIFLHRTHLKAASELLPLNSNISSIINWHGSKYASQPQRF